jgi:threonine/homoserine/homoserine lactone efflux protein
VSELLALALSGFTIGIAYTVVPGPVNAEATRRGLSHGFGAALPVQLGSLVGDVLWAILGLTGAVVVLQRDSLATMLGLIGAGFLFALARSAFRGATGKAETTASVARGNGWRTGIMFSLANPAGIAFWSGVGGGMLGATANPGAIEVATVLGSFIVGSAVCGVLFAALAGLGRRHATGRVMRWVDGVCGLALTWFGVRLLWTSLRRASAWLSPAIRSVV